MDRQLQQTAFIAGDSLTIADISLYAYTQVADEGGFDLSGYAAVLNWMQAVEAEPGYVSMADANGSTQQAGLISLRQEFVAPDGGKGEPCSSQH